ncbi:MAG: hypothetical protein WCI94_07745 [Rhodospirillales bacterium]
MAALGPATGVSGLVLALSFAMLAARRRSIVLGLVAAQASTVAFAAAERGYWAEAAVLPIASAAAIFLSRDAADPALPRIGAASLLGAGGALAALAVPFGVPLAAVLLGILLAAASRDRVVRVLAVLAMQNGIALAGLDAGVVERLVAFVPVVALFPRIRVHAAPPPWRHWAEIGMSAAVLAVALSLPFLSLDDMRFDRAGMFAAILVALTAAVPYPERAAVPRWLAVGGALLAALAADPMLSYAGLALAALLSTGSGRSRRLLAGVALGLVLYGTIAPASSVATGCVLLGSAALAMAAPDLLPVLLLLALRHAGPELAVLGLVAAMASGAAAMFGDRARPAWLVFGQAGVVAVLFGLRTPDTVFAGLVLVFLLVLAQAAQALTRGQGLAALLASVGLAGLPPFGVFPGLAVALSAVGRQTPWLLVGLLPALAALGWAAIVRLPNPTMAPSDRWAPAWIPLGAALLVGFCLPDPIAEWLRALARQVVG